VARRRVHGAVPKFVGEEERAAIIEHGAISRAWTEGVTVLPEGSTIKIICAPEMGNGD